MLSKLTIISLLVFSYSSMSDFMCNNMIFNANFVFIIIVILSYLMDSRIIQSLDYEQEFEEIQIESQDQVLKLEHVKFADALSRLQQKVNQMAQSNFYKQITVHFGAKSKKQLNYLEEHYEKREEILKLELQEQKLFLKGIIESRDEDQLLIREKEHILNKKIVQKQRQAIKDSENFIPCLYIHSQKKNPFYGSINQSFDRKGWGNFTAKIGYRSPFRKYDSLQVNFERPFESLRTKYYQAGLEWTNPLSNIGSYSINVKSANQYIFKGVDNELSSIGWTLNSGKNKYEVDFSHRSPEIHEEVTSNILQEFYRPSTKLAFRFSHIFKNNIRFQDITEGQYSQIKAEVALPLVSQSNFIKFQYRFRKFFDTFKVRDYITNDLLKKFFWKSTLEANLSISSIAQYGRHKYVNDVLDSLDVRGFQNCRVPLPSFANLKTSLKFNIHNYPVLSEGRINTFLYAQTGLSFLKPNLLQPYANASVGVGLSFAAGPLAQIELLCNAAQYQNRNIREPLNFQIRFGIFD